MKKRIYFDNAATTPLRPEVVEAMHRFLKVHHGNPSSIHAEGRHARAAIEEARKTVAQCLNASIGEIFFTSCGTESNNMALKCAVRDLGVRRIISAPTEHHCVLHTLDTLEREVEGIEIKYLDVNKKGQVDVRQLESLLENNAAKTMVSLMHANNEIGTMIDLHEVSRMCARYDALLHSDTVQTVGHFKIDVQETPVHFLSGSAHKFHGPKGCGFVYINNAVQIKPFIDGGGQERNMRGGTENVYGIVGLAEALRIAYRDLEKDKAHILSMRNRLREGLLEIEPGMQVLGDDSGHHLYTVLSTLFPKSEKSDMLLLLLDIAGISASGGSACTSGAESKSHVLEAIGADQDKKAIRFSFSAMNTLDEVEFVLDKIREIMPVSTTAP